MVVYAPECSRMQASAGKYAFVMRFPWRYYRPCWKYLSESYGGERP